MAAVERFPASRTALIPAPLTEQTEVPPRGFSNMENRRSRKHVLDWIGCASFRHTVNDLLGSTGVTINSRDIHRPVGHGDGVEFELPDFCWCFRPRWKVHDCLRSWWCPSSQLNKGSRTPLWDLISTCTVLGRKGLLLVEAKTHEGELVWKSHQARINHDHVRTAVANISHLLTTVSGAKVSLDVDNDYQLAVRVAWATFLASKGIPVALLYLGFTGDSTTPDFLRDDAHWQRSMGAYMLGKLPLTLPEKWLRFPGGGLFSFVIRSRPVLEIRPNGHQRKNWPARIKASPVSDQPRSAPQDKPASVGFGP